MTGAAGHAPSVPEIAPERLEDLRAAAAAAAPAHYAPYSGRRVLAAVEALDGRVFGGANIENAAFNPTVHAEQSAVVAAMHAGVLALGREWLAAVYCTHTPCGMCRQFLAEFAASGALVVVDRQEEPMVLPFWDLLPHGFRPPG